MLLDPQVNGYAGVDFQSDSLTAEQLRDATEAWRRDGGQRFFLTLITDAWPRMMARLRRLQTLVASAPALGEVIAGWHLEGPFLSPEPGYHGAHDPALMQDPQPDHLREFRDTAGGAHLLITLAPERPGAIGAIAMARSLGIVVSLGHTNASASTLRNAAAAGAEGFTHLGNGCPQLLDRHDNILWRVLDTPGLIVGLIPDGHHLSPSLFRLLHRVLPANRLYYTTDAMAAAGAPPGAFTLGALKVEVGEDGIVRQPGGSNFAGSSLRPGQVREQVRTMLGPMADRFLSTSMGNAATWLGIAAS